MVDKTVDTIKKKKIFIWSLFSIGLLTLVALPALGAPDTTENAFSEQVSPTHLVNGELNEPSNAPGDTEEYRFTLTVGEYGRAKGIIRISAVHNGEELERVSITAGEDFNTYYPEGTVVTLDDVSMSGGKTHPVFKFWGGDIGDNSATGTSITINMDSDKEIFAYFDESYFLQAFPSPSDGGTVFPSDDRFYLRNQEVTLTASAAKGYRFDRWRVEQDLGIESSKNNPIKINMDSPKVILALFKRVEIGPEPKGVRGSLPWGTGEGSKVATGLSPQQETEEGNGEDRSMPWGTGKAAKDADDASAQPPEEDLDVEDEETEAEATPTSLEANLSTITETIKDESGCISSTITVRYEAKDLTGGSKPVSSGKLTVDGKEHASWSGTPTTHYQNSTSVEGSGCEKTPLIQLVATNSKGETITTTKEAMPFPVTALFLYQVVFFPGEEKWPWRLGVDYKGYALHSVSDSPLTSVVLKANGQVWDSSGTISDDLYEGSFSKDVDREGGTFNIEVTATNANGDKATYRETVKIPAAPGGEPPPPQTTLWAKVSAGAQCTAYGPECSCQLVIAIHAVDLTTTVPFPVQNVVLKVNGEVWYDSGSILAKDFQHSIQRTVNCGEMFDIVLTVKNTLNQTVTSTTSIITPVP